MVEIKTAAVQAALPRPDKSSPTQPMANAIGINIQPVTHTTMPRIPAPRAVPSGMAPHMHISPITLTPNAIRPRTFVLFGT